MRVLVACEFSGVVRDAFLRRGHDAYSCDILPAEVDGPHLQCDVLEILDLGWDLMIAFPPCTHLAVSGALHFPGKQEEQAAALLFVWELLNAPISKIALENPVSVISSWIRPPDQIIQPYMFGHPEQKKTCLWLQNLPLLVETDDVYDEMMRLPKRLRERVHHESPGPTRWKRRSRTFSGIAAAMAEQWG